MTTANEIISLMLDIQDEQQRQILLRFFKTGKGEYGEGDKFIGMKVPQTRAIMKKARLDVPLEEIEKLLYSKWHEVRLCGFLLLVEEMKAAIPKRKEGMKDPPVKTQRRNSEFLSSPCQTSQQLGLSGSLQWLYHWRMAAPPFTRWQHA